MFKNMPEPPGSLRHHAAGIARSIACSNACPYACMIRKTARLENGATAWGNSAFPPPGGLTKEPGRNLLPSVKLSRLHGKKYPQRLSACPVNAISTVHIQRKNRALEKERAARSECSGTAPPCCIRLYPRSCNWPARPRRAHGPRPSWKIRRRPCHTGGAGDQTAVRRQPSISGPQWA